MIDYRQRLAEDIALINEQLEKYTDAACYKGRESSGLTVILEAMKYSLENGGKRVRPVLTLEFCRLCGGDVKAALPLACAIEMIHTYSLIHDDLPCMDDDCVRRGKPSNHIKFGEATALLAGDALLTLAFEAAAGAKGLDGESKARAVLELAKAAGASGMVAGQVMDLKNENTRVGLDEIRSTDRLKTGELIKAAALLGCIAGKADEKTMRAAEEYCADIGLAFQIIDDILDVTGEEEVLGKPIGSDAENRKSTYVSLLGLEKSEEYAKRLTQAAKASLEGFESAGLLVWLADRLCSRSN